MAGALDKVRVLDITHVLAGPFCTYQLALIGAEVIKIESPAAPDCARGRGPDMAGNADGLGLTYLVQGANKRALALDLKAPEGREILKSLVQGADVMVENFTTDALARLGLGYDVLAGINPSLIHCSITGYGDEGPKASVGAYDNVIQAASGTIGQCGGAKPGVSFVDYSTGYAAAFAIASALVQRHSTGAGCHISVSMLEVAMQMMAPEAAAAQHPVKTSRGKEVGIIDYETADGRIMLGVFHPRQYRDLSTELKRLGDPMPELADIRDWPDVWALGEATRGRLATIFRSRSSADWLKILRAADLPVERIERLSDAVCSDQLKARGFYAKPPEMPDVTLPLAAFHMSRGGAELTLPPPRHGEHSTEVLSELGLCSAEIEDLRTKGVTL